MERHWNVLKFTCGLMMDSSPLIERICQAFVEIATRPKQRESFGSLYSSLYLTDIEREKSANSLSPFFNVELCYNRLGHIQTNHAVHFNHRLFYLNGWDINRLDQITEQHTEHHRAYEQISKVENLTPCSVVIHQGLREPLEYLLTLCSYIIQPIKCLLVFGREERCSGYFASRPQASSIGVAIESVARSEPVRPVTESVLVGPETVSEPVARASFGSNVEMTTEEYEPTFHMKNISKSAISSFTRGLHPFNAVNGEYLTIVVLHNVNCQYLSKSLNECKQLIHLTYINCINPSFGTLGNNKELAQITVEDCTMGMNAKAELFEQLQYLTKLTKISFRGMICPQFLAKLTNEGVISSFELLKSISLKKCFLTTPTVVALMKCLVQCPLVKLDLSNNFLDGFFRELHGTPDMTFKHLERIHCNNCDLRKTDTMALARLVSENRLPAVKSVIMKGNYLANDKVVSEELEKSCEHFRRRKGHRVQIYMDSSNETRKRKRMDDDNDEIMDIGEKDEVKVNNKKEEVQSNK